MVVVNPVLNMYCELMRTKIHRLRMLCENIWVQLSFAGVLKLDTCVISEVQKEYRRPTNRAAFRDDLCATCGSIYM